MNDEQRTYTVIGATGKQGGATVRALQAAGARVRAVTRDPSSPAAKSLAEQGSEVVRADAGDPASLQAAFTGRRGVRHDDTRWSGRY